jgi:uncharacterized protein YabN with tetrapyrrole methylase and pyrophosphatase domain
MEDFANEGCLLKKVEKQELIAKEFGFYWESFLQLIEQIQSECREVQEAWNKEDMVNLQEEIGDLMQAVISLSVFCKLDPCETLSKSIEKFQRRYNLVVHQAHNEGYENLHQQSFETLMNLWELAKTKTKQ